tara:strand:+ start:156 stop:644 length:489 start_codon:yes stop_codon:yes gene_type:complete
MSDYSFMKAGRNTTNHSQSISESDKESIEVLLALFISNSMINASNYVKYCNRNGITQTDIIYGLKYEVFEFCNRNTLTEDIKSMTDDYENEKNSEECLDLDDFIVDDNEIEPFKRISLEQINDENKDFINKMHNYYDLWETWNPQTQLEQILKSSIDKINLE